MDTARSLQRRLVNPLVRLAFRLGVPDPGDALLQTRARQTGRPRLTPVCDGLDGERFWVLSERGRDAEWVRDVEADPRVRVQLRSRRPGAWRSGTATIVDEDPDARRRILSRAGWWRRLCLGASAALTGGGVTIRIDLDATASPRHENPRSRRGRGAEREWVV
jgi:deazaflavin-dependent oxidoreductase (nitroreductase family)